MSSENTSQARERLTARIPEAPRWLDTFDNWSTDNPDKGLAVLKVGGDIIDNPTSLTDAVKAIKSLSDVGYKSIVVHGGGKQITDHLSRTGREPFFNNGLRFTSPEDLEVIEPALRGVNSSLVRALKWAGISAAGLNKVLTAEHIDQEEYGEVGHVTAVDYLLITELLANNQIPVVNCLAHIAFSDIALNVNADDAAKGLVRALQPLKYISFTPTGGVLLDGEILPEITDDIARLMEQEGTLDGGMLKKVNVGLDMVNDGVIDEVILVDPKHLEDELFSNDGYGTIIKL